jgi:hypothetical protein
VSGNEVLRKIFEPQTENGETSMEKACIRDNMITFTWIFEK